MKPNVLVTHRKGGKLVGRHEEHNVWTYQGRLYLAQMLGEVGTELVPYAERTDCLRYVGLGIGGKLQTSGLVDASPLVDAYPVGYAAERYPPTYSISGYSSGKVYDQEYPIGPRIDTLERPVRRTGGSSMYPGESSDRWYIEPPNFFLTHLSPSVVRVHALLDATAGDYVYSPFTSIPISEAGLFTSNASGAGVPYEALVAYVGFSTILLLDATSVVEITWEVRL